MIVFADVAFDHVLLMHVILRLHLFAFTSLFLVAFLKGPLFLINDFIYYK